VSLIGLYYTSLESPCVDQCIAALCRPLDSRFVYTIWWSPCVYQLVVALCVPVGSRLV
jgi:hypothetical protein